MRATACAPKSEDALFLRLLNPHLPFRGRPPRPNSPSARCRTEECPHLARWDLSCPAEDPSFSVLAAAGPPAPAPAPGAGSGSSSCPVSSTYRSGANLALHSDHSVRPDRTPLHGPPPAIPSPRPPLNALALVRSSTFESTRTPSPPLFASARLACEAEHERDAYYYYSYWHSTLPGHEPIGTEPEAVPRHASHTPVPDSSAQSLRSSASPSARTRVPPSPPLLRLPGCVLSVTPTHVFDSELNRPPTGSEPRLRMC